MTRTRIAWADYTWNPVWGCRGGCPYCYARGIARRFGLRVCGRDDFVPTWIERNFSRPFPRRPARIFVNSMSDVADWTPEWAERVEDRMRSRPEHRFLFLTKRPWEIAKLPCPSMLGYSVTRQEDLDDLIPGRRWGVEFLSIEPLLGPVLRWPTRWTPRWIIVGAETGNRKGKVRPVLGWLLDIQRVARERGIPLFFKSSLREVWPAIDDEAFPQEHPAL